MRILVMDHGEKRLGIAVSNPSGLLARLLTVTPHRSRASDVAQVFAPAREYRVERIVAGISFDEQGRPNSRDAPTARLQAGAPRKKRRGHSDEWAAAMSLQSCLDRLRPSGQGERREGQDAPGKA